MGATRLVLTVGVVGVATGAFLALAIVPSLAPYRERSRDSLPIVVRDERPDETGYASEDSWASNDSWNVTRGPQGTLVLEMPRWAEQTGAWFALGQQALRTWRGWSDPEDGDEHLAEPSRWGEQERYADREEPRLVPSGPEPRAVAPAPERDVPGEAAADAASDAAQRAWDAARDVRAVEAETW